MSFDTFKDYLISFIGAVLLLVSLVLIPEIRKSKKYWIPIIVLIILLIFLGIDKTNRDRNEKTKNETQKARDSVIIDTMKSTIKSIDLNFSKLKEEQKSFLDRLEKIGVARDSTNHPYIINKKNFTNYIKDVGTLIQQ